MSDELPQGWATTTLGDTCSKPQYGWTSPAAKVGSIKYLRTTDISAGRVDWPTVPYCAEAPDDVGKYRVRENDILVARAGSVGVSYRINDAPDDVVFASYLIRFKPLSPIEPKYIELFLKSDGYWRSISEFSAGIAVPNINASKLAALELPLAPAAEQRRIVAKLEKLLDKVDACQQQLAKIPVLLKRFRQSVLAAACSGRLTADWRDENPGCLPPPAKSQNNGSDVNFPTEDLPDGWQVQRVDHAATIIDCLHKTPKYADSGYPMVRVTDVKGGDLDLSSARFVSEEVFREFTRRYTPRRGDIVFSRVGSFGNVSYVDSDTKFCLGQNTAIISPNSNPRFLHLSLESPTVRDQMDAAVVGTSQPTISLKSISALAVPIPPLAEQQEIVRRVEQLFALADQLEARYAKAKAHVDKLTQSILAKAFRGELVPQDPNDEPASVLLERVRQSETGIKTPAMAKRNDKLIANTRSASH